MKPKVYNALYIDMRCEMGKYYDGLDKCMLYEVYDEHFVCKVIKIKYWNDY